jgi:hypothetical protein
MKLVDSICILRSRRPDGNIAGGHCVLPANHYCTKAFGRNRPESSSSQTEVNERTWRFNPQESVASTDEFADLGSQRVHVQGRV